MAQREVSISQEIRAAPPAQAAPHELNKNTKGTFQDPAFALNRSVPVHRWVPWIAGYSQAFAADVIEKFSPEPGQLVLDPFTGVGTTLIEADRLGHRAVGFEINPYAAFAASIKLRSHKLDTGLLRETTQKLQQFGLATEEEGTDPRSTPPKGFRTKAPFYSPDVEKKVLLLLDFVENERKENQETADVLRLAFAATMVDYSNYSYEPSLGRKTTVGRPMVMEFPVFESLAEKLLEIADDAERFREERATSSKEDAVIHVASFLDDYWRVDKHSVNLMVTSPPYMNNYHYNRNTRPQMYWLGFYQSPQELKTLEKMNFGTYWQNARDQKHIPLNPLVQNTEIRDTLDEIREQNPGGKTYGGQGWANYATAYLNDCVRFMRGLRWSLHPGGTGLIVIGNSIIQGVPVPTDKFMAIIAEQCGLAVRKLETPRETRVGNSIIHSNVRNGKAAEGSQLYESVMELGQRK